MFRFQTREIKKVPDEEITELFNKIKTSRSIDRLIEMQHEISELHNKWLIENVGRFNLDMGQSYKSAYSEVLSFLAKRIELLDPNFGLNPEISHNETINGYKLYDCKGCVFCYSDFIELRKLFLDGSEQTMDYGDFYEQFDKIACTEWSKMNTTGDDWYVGFWKAEEGTDERENAWNLTRKQNAKALFDLPYSKTFLLKTIDHGCGNRMESVRYSNFLSVWFKRKLRLMNTQGTEIDEDALDNQYENYLRNFYASLYPSAFKPRSNDMWFEFKDGKYVNVANEKQCIQDAIYNELLKIKEDK